MSLRVHLNGTSSPDEIQSRRSFRASTVASLFLVVAEIMGSAFATQWLSCLCVISQHHFQYVCVHVKRCPSKCRDGVSECNSVLFVQYYGNAYCTYRILGNRQFQITVYGERQTVM